MISTRLSADGNKVTAANSAVRVIAATEPAIASAVEPHLAESDAAAADVQARARQIAVAIAPSIDASAKDAATTGKQLAAANKKIASLEAEQKSAMRKIILAVAGLSLIGIAVGLYLFFAGTALATLGGYLAIFSGLLLAVAAFAWEFYQWLIIAGGVIALIGVVWLIYEVWRNRSSLIQTGNLVTAVRDEIKTAAPQIEQKIFGPSPPVAAKVTTPTQSALVKKLKKTGAIASS